MKPQIEARIAEELKNRSELIGGIRKDMKFLREQAGLTLEEISYLSGYKIKDIIAQEEGTATVNLGIISPVVLIYYMFVFENVPQWLLEKLYCFRHQLKFVRQ